MSCPGHVCPKPEPSNKWLAWISPQNLYAKLSHSIILTDSESLPGATCWAPHLNPLTSPHTRACIWALSYRWILTLRHPLGSSRGCAAWRWGEWVEMGLSGRSRSGDEPWGSGPATVKNVPRQHWPLTPTRLSSRIHCPHYPLQEPTAASGATGASPWQQGQASMCVGWGCFKVFYCPQS